MKFSPDGNKNNRYKNTIIQIVYVIVNDMMFVSRVGRGCGWINCLLLRSGHSRCAPVHLLGNGIHLFYVWSAFRVGANAGSYQLTQLCGTHKKW